jgi:transketolase
MRNAFAAAVTELAMADRRVVLLTGDIGNRLFDTFKEKAPGRFFNCGVAEANMTGMAAGMALCGLRPFTYTITPFASTRALEQIRLDVCYHNVPVVIVGTGSGLSYASLGPTHHSCEDVAMLRSLPNLTVLCPADAAEVRQVVRAVVQLPGPAYIRLGKKGEPQVHQALPELVIGRALVVRSGSRVCLIGMGPLVAMAQETAKVLEARQGLSAEVVSMATVKPLDQEFLREAFQRFEVVAVLEEHSRIGGLGAAVAEWLAEQRPQPRPRAALLSFGTPDAFLDEAGSQDYLRERVGLTAQRVAEETARLLEERKAAGEALCGTP